MQSRFHPRFKKPITILQPGDYYACKDDRILATILGSCVAVCLKDNDSGVCGMNHFMLPGDFSSMEIFNDPTGRYGMFAMEMLLGEMIKLGCQRDNLTAKVFGGGHVLNYAPSKNSVPANNINFIKAFLNMEGIKILKEDLGGFQGRKVLFFTKDNKIYIKKLGKTVDPRIIKAEEAYTAKLASQRVKTDLTLF